MRSPRGRGAGLRSALSLTILLSLSAVGGGSTLAGHHETDEADPEPTRIIVIDARMDTILVGGKIRLDISICKADGSSCKPAGRTTVTAEPKGVVKPNKGRGAQVLFTGKSAGTVTFTAKQGGAMGTFTLRVNEPPDREPAAVEEFRLYVVPQERVVGVGEVFRLNAWGCPMRPDGRLGANDVADGLDDGCQPVPIQAVNLDTGSPLTLRALQGPTAVLSFDMFPAGVDGELVFLGAQVSTDIGGTLPSLQGERTPVTDPLYYDMNQDGAIDQADQDILSGALPGVGEAPTLPSDPAFQTRFDVNGDQVMDPQDLDLFGLLAPDTVEGASTDDADPLDVPGDANGDGEVTSADFDVITQAAMESGVEMDRELGDLLASTLSNLDAGQAASGDISRDGVVDETDVLIVRELMRRDESADGEKAFYDAAVDMDGDGDVDDGDFDLLLRASAEAKQDN